MRSRGRSGPTASEKLVADDQTVEHHETPEGNRKRNTIATPEFLATIVTCCVCKGPIPAGRRYLCEECSE